MGQRASPFWVPKAICDFLYDEGPTEAASAELWVDEEPAAWSLTFGRMGPDVSVPFRR